MKTEQFGLPGCIGHRKSCAEEILSEGGCVGSDLPTADFSWAEGVDNMRCVTGSVSDVAHNALAVETAVSEFGHLDGAVLNAGMAGRIDLFDGDMEFLMK
ncbi:MAG: hypothetical protein CM15mP49_33290 [Actinomycetota bacterium]|nr:MAG: hypothetical protein CM15mP49_33290 [Actinomycetota bacterium]